jgi:hypothetical protein
VPTESAVKVETTAYSLTVVWVVLAALVAVGLVWLISRQGKKS